MNASKQFDQLRVSTMAQRFRKELRSGNQPTIEEHLAGASEVSRSELFRELLSLELSSLRESGTEPQLDTYVARFPDFEAIVREQFNGFDSFQMSFDSTMSQGTSGLDASTARIYPTGSLPQLKRYRLLERLGRGGFGEVWRAFDEETNRYVAIKGPRTDREITPDRLQQFLAEAERVRELKVEGVVEVLDVVHANDTGTAGSLCFIVMELMDGGSLVDHLEDGVPRRTAVRWMASLSDTLAELHRHDVVHRDIKPENILFDERGRPHLSDFGLAATEEEQLAEGPAVLGTVAYMAPEQARGTHVDRRADIYSLGVVLYRLLSGNKLPYLANNRHEYLKQLLDKHVAPRAMPDTVPHRLAHICERCVHKEASQRFRTASELGRDLRTWLRGYRKPAALVGIASALLVAVIAAAVASRPSGDLTPAPLAATPAELPPPGATHEEPARPKLVPPGDPVNGQSDVAELALPINPIAWPHDDVSTWSVLDSGKTIHVSTEHISLLGVGQVEPGKDVTIDIDLRQLEWVGRAGIFFGHRINNTGATRFDVIELRNYGGQFECLRSVREYQSVAAGISESQVARAKIPPLGRGAQSLSIIIKSGRVNQVFWNGEVLNDLARVRSKHAERVADCSGAFGFFNMGSAAAFSRLRINGAQRSMRKLDIQ